MNNIPSNLVYNPMNIGPLVVPFSSPAKKARLPDQKGTEGRVQNLVQNVSHLLCHEKLEDIEGALPLFQTNSQSELIKVHLGFIRDWVGKKNFLYSEKVRLSQKCTFILSRENWSLDRKLAELGTLYYYLTCDKTVPDSESLLHARLLEIRAWTSQVSQMHSQNLGLESGAHLSEEVLYVRRTLMHMIFTNDGLFNWGGLLAVRELLTSVGSILGREGYKQMVAVVNCLITDESFRAHFETPFEIHEKAADFIRIDLMLPPDAPLHFTYVRWALLSALFSIEGQYEEGNCFAVALTLILQRSYQNICIKYLIEALKTGSITFEGKKISIELLIKADLKTKEEPLTSLNSNQSYELLEFLIDHCHPKKKNQPNEVQGGFSKDPFYKIFGEHCDYARALYLSQRRSILQMILLRYFQFCCLNATQFELVNIENSPLGSEKLCLIDSIRNYLLPKVTQEAHSLIQKLTAELIESLFLIDHLSESSIAKGRVCFDFHHKGLIFIGSEEDYSFTVVRRLYSIEKDRSTPIDSLTALQGHLLASLNKVAPAQFEKCKNSILNEIKQPAFRSFIADYLYEKNSKISRVKALTYLDSDAFFLGQIGGNPFTPCFSKELISLLKPQLHIIKAVSVEGWFKQIQELALAYRESQKPLLNDHSIIISTRDHSFRLHLSDVQDFLETKDVIQQKIVIPALKLLSKKFTELDKTTILLRCGVGNVLPEETKKKLHKVKKASTFISHALNCKEIAQRVMLFSIACEEELMSIPKEKIKDVASHVMSSWLLPNSVHKAVFAFLDEKLQLFSSMLPHELAELLQSLLQRHDRQRKYEVFQIRNLICSAMDFPVEIPFGDLNWSKKVPKKELNLSLIGFDFINKLPTFFVKKNNLNYRIDVLEKLLEETFLLFI